MLDTLLWLGESSYEVRASHQQVDDSGKLLHASGTLGFGSAMGSYSMVRLAGVDLEKVELHGSGRSVEVTNLESAVFYDKNAAPRLRTFGSWDTVLERRGFAGVVQHFLNSLDDPNACGIRGIWCWLRTSWWRSCRCEGGLTRSRSSRPVSVQAS